MVCGSSTPAPGQCPVVSVVIVTRNTCALTCAAIRSVEESQGAPSSEVIVVDNGSTDDTPQALPRALPAAIYLRSATNLGYARACNLGVEKARGEFVLLLNSDARLKPDALATATAWMREHADCGVAGAQLLNSDGSKQNSIANLPTLATELLNKSLLRRLFPRRYPGKEQSFSAPVEVESVVGAFFLVRATLWRALQGLDERFFFFLEETDFCFRTRAQGLKVYHLPQAEVWHEQGQSAQQMPAGARIEYWRSRYAYFQKNCSRLTCAILGAGLRIRLGFDWLGSGLLLLASLGKSSRWRAKHDVATALWDWHLRRCPIEMGLPR